MSIADWATTISGAIAVGGVMLLVLRLWIKSLHEDTKQLQHNGGTHVADYARDARDAAREAVTAVAALGEKFTVHLVEAARKDAEQDALLRVLMGGRPGA